MHTKLISPPIYNGVRIVNRPDLHNVQRTDRGIMPMVSAMERTGITIDPDHIAKLKLRLTTEMEALAAKVGELAGKTINIASGDQLSELLFGHLGLKQLGSREKWTKSKARLAADSDVLKAMVSQHPCIRPILDWKEREKLRSTYTTSLVALADSHLRIHTDFSLTTAETGRLASRTPNLQNIPIRTDLGVEIRNAFIPGKGLCLGSADASQIEMRMNCFDSQCKNMLRFFEEKEDFYWGTASLMYKRPFPAPVRSCECPTNDKGKQEHVADCPTIIHAPGEHYDGFTHKKWYRDICAKVTALMVGYDASASGLYDQFLAWGVPGWTEALCEQAIRDYFAGYPELLIRKRTHHQRAVRYGFVWDLGGRIRWIPQLKSCHKRVVGEGLRQAGNMAGQGGAAFIIKLWMAIIWGDMDYWHKHGVRLLLQIHDELLAEGPRAALEDFLGDAVRVLETMLVGFEQWFNVPLGGSMGIGDVGVPWGRIGH